MRNSQVQKIENDKTKTIFFSCFNIMLNIHIFFLSLIFTICIHWFQPPSKFLNNRSNIFVQWISKKNLSIRKLRNSLICGADLINKSYSMFISIFMKIVKMYVCASPFLQEYAFSSPKNKKIGSQGSWIKSEWQDRI